MSSAFFAGTNEVKIPCGNHGSDERETASSRRPEPDGPAAPRFISNIYEADSLKYNFCRRSRQNRQ